MHEDLRRISLLDLPYRLCMVYKGPPASSKQELDTQCSVALWLTIAFLVGSSRSTEGTAAAEGRSPGVLLRPDSTAGARQ